MSQESDLQAKAVVPSSYVLLLLPRISISRLKGWKTSERRYN